MSALQPRPLAPRAAAAPAPITTKIASTPLQKVERQYTKFLAKRYMSAYLGRVALWTVLVLAGASVCVTGSASSGLYALIYAIPTFISLAIILKLRKSFITEPYRPAPQTSVVQLFLSSFWDPRAITLLAAYYVFGLTVSNAWLSLLGRNNLGFFTPTMYVHFKCFCGFKLLRNDSRHPWQLNEHRVILVFSNACLLTTIAARDILGDKLKPTWPTERKPLGKAVQAALLSEVWTSTRIGFTFSWSVIAPFAYCWFGIRTFVWQWANWRILASTVRPFVGNFARQTSKTPSPWSLLGPMLVLNFVALVILQFPVKALMAYTTQPLHFDQFYKKSPLSQDQYLITALKSKDKYHLQFTLMELLRVAHIPASRKALFDNISRSPVPVLALWEDLLLHFGTVHHTLITRGSTSRPLTPAQPSTSSSAQAIPIKQGDIFRPQPQAKSSSFNIKAAFDGPIRPSAPPPAVAKEISKVGDLAKKRIGEAQGMALGRIEATGVGASFVGEARVARRDVHEWAGREWARRSVRVVLGDAVIVQRVIDIMVLLAGASIQEDTYGNVQQVLPSTLEAIVRFRDAVKLFELELVGKARVLGPAQESGLEEIKESLGEIVNYCEDSVRKVAADFGQSLGAFRFPPVIAHSLGEICKPSY
ncbi:hypothetical protein L202_06907 [Cryptococcus amylolentus CBS 6039]|uniref:Nucleoporin protein Ndc1-Nup n=1 Tax=Cryptococcus amylolentus CBS 6039 TaxID=1295533 RepID=A0A1E3HDY4_9TREE|nr:hypothetical protein L202_06907 [Cryptococcus amylolentus CBS 6039]ODN74534.1 hypothetical protein L202_06907 [Cryptococcus amylolentus CBS 6039]